MEKPSLIEQIKDSPKLKWGLGLAATAVSIETVTVELNKPEFTFSAVPFIAASTILLIPEKIKGYLDPQDSTKE